MSIRSETFKVCKYFIKNDFRIKLQKIFEEANNYEPKEGEKINSLSYLYSVALSSNLQFYGLILAKNKLDEESKNLGIPPIDIDKGIMELLAKAHSIFDYIDEMLLKKFVEYSPNISSFLNPYKKFNYEQKVRIDDIMNVNIINNLITAFNESEIIKGFFGISNPYFSNLSPNDLERLLKIPLARIHQSVHRTPQDIYSLIYQIKNCTIKGNEAEVGTQILILLSVKELIQNINQLIYQSFFIDKIFGLNEDFIIKIINDTTHALGRGLTIMTQMLPHINVSDIIYVNYDMDEDKIGETCIVETLTTSINQDFGAISEFELRALNEDLNPFFGAFR